MEDERQRDERGEGRRGREGRCKVEGERLEKRGSLGSTPKGGSARLKLKSISLG